MRYLSRNVEIIFKAMKYWKEKCTVERFLVWDCQRLFLHCFFHSRRSWQKKRAKREIFDILLQIVHCLVYFSLAGRRIKRIDFCSLNSKPNQYVTQSSLSLFQSMQFSNVGTEKVCVKNWKEEEEAHLSLRTQKNNLDA